MKEREKKRKKKRKKGKKKEQEWMKRTEDINKNNFYIRVGIQELEGLLNLLLRGSSSDIQKVCWVATFQLQKWQMRDIDKDGMRKREWGR